VLFLAISYNKLWKILIDKRMKKKDLIAIAELSTSTLAKMGKDQHVSMDVIIRICKCLECDVGDIMEVIPD